MFKGICCVYEAVASLARSREFFEKQLGFRLNTNAGPVHGYAFGSGYLIADEGSPAKAGKRGEGSHVCVEVPDVDAYHATLKQRGVAVSELNDRPWGQRDFFLTDPDGYVWCFAQGMR